MNNTDNNKKTFDDIKRTDKDNAYWLGEVNKPMHEFWYARELQEILQYTEWRNFKKVISTAQIACKVSLQNVEDHFVVYKKQIISGKGKQEKIDDYRLTRYACYLIVMNADPRKEIIALGQTYFAVKTRQKELEELYDRLTEDERRLFLRGDIKQKNMLLFEAAKKAGIETTLEYAIFTNKGYEGLYDGLKENDIKERKGLVGNKEILDYMGSAELGANLFRITQTEDVLKNRSVTNRAEAGDIHYRVGRAVRKAIAEVDGIMPEDQPLPEKSILELQQEQKLALKGKKN